MSKLYGRLTSNRSSQPATKPGDKWMDGWLQTEYARIWVCLDSNGVYRVDIYPVLGRDISGPGRLVASGNIHEEAKLSEWTPAS